MKKTTKILAALLVPCGLLASNAFAGLTTTLELSTSGYRDSHSVGGEFTAFMSGNTAFNSYVMSHYSSKAKATAVVNGKSQTGFETFCVEFNQSFSPNTPYNTTVSQSISGGSHSFSDLTVGTAYLYSQFAQGSLSGYNYTPGTGREKTSDQLQDAIWYLQGEISNGYQAQNELYKFNSTTDPFLTLVNSLFGSHVTDSVTDYGNNFGVMVLNLTSKDKYGRTVYNQDQLVYCPVPEPATFAAGALLLLPLGWSAVRALRAKKSKNV